MAKYTDKELKTLIKLKFPRFSLANTEAVISMLNILIENTNEKILANQELNGTNYLIVYGTGTPEENGIELQNAYNLAKTMPRFIGILGPASPTYVYAGQTFASYIDGLKYYKILEDGMYTPLFTSSAFKVTESEAISVRTTVLVAPGIYRFDKEFVHDSSGIDIKSLTGETDVYITTLDGNMMYSFGVETGFTTISGINTTFNSNYPSIRLAPDLDNIVFNKCIGGQGSFWDFDLNMQRTYRGTFIDCIAGINSFVSGLQNHTFIAKCIRCTAGTSSFGRNATIGSGSYFEDCKGEDFCFGSTDGEYPSTIQQNSIFRNCIAKNYSFGFNAQSNGGQYYYCINEGANSGVLNGSKSLYCSKNGVI